MSSPVVPPQPAASVAAPPAPNATVPPVSVGVPPLAAPIGQPIAPHVSASLYVGDLNPEVSEAHLFDMFNAVGPVQSVRVCRDAATRRSLGYAYVNFHRVEDAERALDLLNFKDIKGRACRIMWSHRDPSLRKSGVGNVFVNHLAKSIDNKTLYDTFSMFGNILSCKVATNSKKESLGYGFVHYETEEAANNAIGRVDGKVIAGEKVSVSHFKSKKERGGANSNKFTNVFVKNLPGEISLEEVNALFSKQGNITSSVVQQDRDNKARSYAFVNFATSEEAQAAVAAFNNYEHNGRKLYVARAQKKEEREKELHERFEMLKLERQKKYAGVNLYVKNLPDEFDDSKFTAEFSKFGNITNAIIMRDPNSKKSRGFGFVCYSTPEEATKAVTEMNGKMIEGKPLYVALAQRKEQRRAQLEAQHAARAKMSGIPGAPSQANGMYGGGSPLMFNGMQQQTRPQYSMYSHPSQQMMRQWNGNPNAMVGMNPRGVGPMGPVNYPVMPMNQRMGGVNPMQPNGPRGNQNRGPRTGPRGAMGGQGGMMPKGLQQGMGPGMPPAGLGVNMMGMGVGVPPMGMMTAMGPGGQVPQQNLRYADNVRNRNPQQPNPMVPNGQMMGGAGVGVNGVAQPGVGGVNVGGPQEPIVMPAPNEPLTIKQLAAAPEEMRKQMIGERLFPLIKMQEPGLAGKITGMLLEMDNGELIHLLESQHALNEKIAEALNVLQNPQAQEQAEEEADK